MSNQMRDSRQKISPVGGPEEAMRTIIRHWSIITGREMKARRVTPS